MKEATMKMHSAVAWVALAALPFPRPSFADTCAPIMRAAGAQAKAERYAVKMTIASKGETHQTEVMTAPEGMYIKAGEQWIRSPVSINRKDLLDANKSTFSDCSRVGQESVDGVPTAVYRFTGKAEGQAPMAGKIWIGTADNLPRKLEARSQDTDITQLMRYDVQVPKGAALEVPGLDQIKGLFGR
jgi:outer membrane lipoprotein-sorting protein